MKWKTFQKMNLKIKMKMNKIELTIDTNKKSDSKNEKASSFFIGTDNILRNNEINGNSNSDEIEKLDIDL